MIALHAEHINNQTDRHAATTAQRHEIKSRVVVVCRNKHQAMCHANQILHAGMNHDPLNEINAALEN